MNRTRLVFFGVLVVCLAILAASLVRQALSAAILLQVYVASTVFAAGVLTLDFLGLLEHGGDAGTGHDFGTLTGHGGGHDFGDHLSGGDHVGHAGGSHHAGAPDTHTAGHDGHDGHEAAHAANGRATPALAPNPAPILSVLAYLRLFVYFCLGFGPAGWAGMAAGRGTVGSLVIAVPVGLAALFLARAFFRFQRKDTGAVAAQTELVGEHATVVVPLDHETMGKVRVEAGMNVEEIYALAEDGGRAFGRGDQVRIVRVTEDCVKVR